MTKSNVAMNMMGNPSIYPNPHFNARNSAEYLHKAMDGKGCNKEMIIQAICSINNNQRQSVAQEFKDMFGKQLVVELKKELSGDFEKLLLALMERPSRYDTQQLHQAIAGLGTNEAVLTELLVTHPNNQIREMKSLYRHMYGKDLDKEIIGDTSGAFKDLLVALSNGSRDQSSLVDHHRAQQDASVLYQTGEGKKGVDPTHFLRVLAHQNFNQLQAVFNEYEKLAGHPIENAILSEFKGDSEAGFLAVVKCVRNRAAFLAEMLYNSMKGYGTRDDDLIRLVVSRSEIDLADIRNEYQKMYNVSLEKSITDDCSGAYKEALIALVKGN